MLSSENGVFLLDGFAMTPTSTETRILFIALAVLDKSMRLVFFTLSAEVIVALVELFWHLIFEHQSDSETSLSIEHFVAYVDLINLTGETALDPEFVNAMSPEAWLSFRERL
jgi:hypothetical protein